MDQTPGKKVLVVEDEPDAREIFIDILSSEGLVVEGAAGGIEALEKIMTGKFDLVLLDIVMPDRDGVQTLAEIKKDPAKYGNSKIVMLTNIGGDLAIDKAMQLGANGYMLKSETEPAELVAIVKKYLELS